MKVECIFTEKVSKDNVKYRCLYLPLLDRYIFLERAEIKLLDYISNNNK